jgi:hypothetical protein
LWPTQSSSQRIPAGIERPGREADNSPPPSAAVKIAWNYSYAPSHAFSSRSLIKRRDNRYMRQLPVHAPKTGTCANNRYMHQLPVHAPKTGTCAKNRYMRQKPVHAPKTGTCAKNRYMRQKPVHAPTIGTCAKTGTCANYRYMRQQSVHAPKTGTCAKNRYMRQYLYENKFNLLNTCFVSPVSLNTFSRKQT